MSVSRGVAHHALVRLVHGPVGNQGVISGDRRGRECKQQAEQVMLRIERLAVEEAGRTASVASRLHAETIAGIRRYIHFHFSEPLTVALLAHQAAMSTRRFAEMFREVCGKPPMRYVMDVRVDRAAELLRGGRATVSQVAYRTGFSSVHYFSRVFRRYRGMPPAQYQRAATADDTSIQQ